MLGLNCLAEKILAEDTAAKLNAPSLDWKTRVNDKCYPCYMAQSMIDAKAQSGNVSFSDLAMQQARCAPCFTQTYGLNLTPNLYKNFYTNLDKNLAPNLDKNLDTKLKFNQYIKNNK